MSTREDLIVSAMKQRLAAVQDRIARLPAAAFSDADTFIKQLKNATLELSLEKPSGPDFEITTWLKTRDDCLSNLRALSLGETLEVYESSGPGLPAETFLQALEECRRDSEQRFLLVCERFSCAPNFALPTESAIREHVLMRLMVQDRATIERQSVAALDADDLLLKLNLIAVEAQLTSDLRFLDALNYYYELLPADWVPRARHAWLVASFLGLYARALAVQILRNQTIAHSHTREHTPRGAANL